MQYSFERNTKAIAEAYGSMYESDAPKHYGVYVLSPDKKLLEGDRNTFFRIKRGEDVDVPQEFYEPELLGGRDYDEEGNPSPRTYFYEWDGNVDYGDLDRSVPEDAMFHVNGGSLLVVFEYDDKGVQKNPRFFKALQRGWREVSDGEVTKPLLVKLGWFKGGKGMNWEEVSSFIDDSTRTSRRFEQLKSSNLVDGGERPKGSVSVTVGGKTEVWKDPTAAIKYYKYAASETEGSESERYSRIAYQLQNGETDVDDGSRSDVSESDWTKTMPDKPADGYAFGIMPYYIKYDDGGFVPYHLSGHTINGSDAETMSLEMQSYVTAIAGEIARRSRSTPYDVFAEKCEGGVLVLDADEVRIAPQFGHCIVVPLDGGDSRQSYVVFGVYSPNDGGEVMNILQSTVEQLDGMGDFADGRG